MLGVLVLANVLAAFALGDTACSDGETITPLSVTMSSTKKKKFGPDNCVDGDLDTTCRTKNEPYPTLTIDFGKVVEIGQVKVFPDKIYPKLSEARVVVSNKTTATGSRADGYEVDVGPYFYLNTPARGRYLIVQRDQAGRGGALSLMELKAFCPIKGSYVPGTPGGAWTEEEVLIVKEKVRYMVNYKNAKTLYHANENFPPIVDVVYGDTFKTFLNASDTSMNYYRNHSFMRSDNHLAPTTRKLIQLAFHDCLKNVDSEGNHFGGCDGCLNWEGMDLMYQVPFGVFMTETAPIWPSYRAMPIKYKTDNNKLSTTVMALELIYTDPTWPPGGPKSLPSSLFKTGKSRADLWQLAANTALEIEIAKANYGCSHKVSYQQMVVALEGKEKCLWKLQEPVPFQYGRIDCVRDQRRAATKFPFEATNKESHSNPWGEGSRVLEDLKRDFGMTARQSIALMAAHGIPPEKHNRILGIEYKWAGSPFLSNNYFKTLGSRPQYNLNSGLRLGSQNSDGALIGDQYGRPLAREVQGDFTITMKNWWNTSHPDSGPWFFRPMTVNVPKNLDPSLMPRTPCFTYNYTSEMYERKVYPYDWADWLNSQCESASINQETGVQTGGPGYGAKGSKGFTFYLPYEMGFVKNFTVDSENHPRGCNFPDVFPKELYPDPKWIAQHKIPISCTRSNYKLAGEEQTSADIVDEFADDHEVWAHAFIEGWQVIQRNGYDKLNDGPKSSWLGYSLLPEGSPVEFPLLFTERPGFDVTAYLQKDQAISCTRPSLTEDNCH